MSLLLAETSAVWYLYGEMKPSRALRLISHYSFPSIGSKVTGQLIDRVSWPVVSCLFPPYLITDSDKRKYEEKGEGKEELLIHII